VLLVAALLAPKFLSIHILPVEGLVTLTIVVAPDAQNTDPEGYELLTVRFNVQLCPPMFSAKLAVPAPLGVPVMV
jgi:hypothetical protein